MPQRMVAVEIERTAPTLTVTSWAEAGAVRGKPTMPRQASRMRWRAGMIDRIASRVERSHRGYHEHGSRCLGHKVGVACEPPAAVRFFPQDGQRVAGSAHRSAVWRGYHHLDVISKIRPIPEHLELVNVAGPLH